MFGHHQPKPPDHPPGMSEPEHKHRSGFAGFFKPRPPSERGSNRFSMRGLFSHAPRPPSVAYDEHEFKQNKVSKEEMKEKYKNMSKFEKLEYKLETKFKGKFILQRLLLVGLALSLLFASSLQVINSYVGAAIPSPGFKTVINELEETDALITSESEAYSACVTSEADQCEIFVNTTFNSEVKRVEDMFEHNQDILRRFAGIRTNCSQNFDAGVYIISVVNNASNAGFLSLDNYIRNSPNCTGVEEFLSSQFASQRAYDLTKSTVLKGDSAVDDLTRQLNERAEYDKQYLENKTIALGLNISDLSQFLTDPDAFYAFINNTSVNITACLDESTLTECEPPFIGEYIATFKAYNDTYQQLRADAQAVFDEVEEAYALYQRVTDQIYAVLDNTIIQQALDAFNLNGDWNVDYPSEFLNQFTDFGQDELVDGAYNLANGVANNLSKLGDEFANATNEFTNGRDAFTEAFFDDYDPPPVDDGSEYNAVAASTPDEVAEATNYVPDTPSAEELPDIRNKAEKQGANLLSSVKDREFSIYVYGDAFENIEGRVDDVIDLIYALDWAFRCLQAILIIKKFWSVSNIQTPPADVRTEAGIAGGEYTAKKNIFQQLGALLASPLVSFVLFAAGALFIAYLFVFAYQPFYYKYREGCIENTDVEDIRYSGALEDEVFKTEGTMLYRMGYSVASTLVFLDGDKISAERIDKANVDRDIRCIDEFETANIANQNQEILKQALFEDQKEFVPNLVNIDYCIDFEQLDTDMAGFTYDFSGAPSDLQYLMVDRTLKSLFNVTACAHEFAEGDTIPSGTPTDFFGDFVYETEISGEFFGTNDFNCSNIRLCAVDECLRQEAAIRDQSRDASCTTESFLHSIVLKPVFVLFIYTVFNVSRYYFMRGMIAVWFKQLVNRYAYLATCTIDGETIYPEAVTRDGEIFQEVILKQLGKSLKSFQRSGYALVAATAALNVPWIIGLIVLSQGLSYDS